MVRAHEALGEDEVDDEEQEHAGLDEDGGGDGQRDVARARGPGDAEREGDDARHAEGEEHDREDELVAAPAVDLEDGHVRDGAGGVQGQQRGAYGVVQRDGGRPAELGVGGRVRGAGLWGGEREREGGGEQVGSVMKVCSRGAFPSFHS